MNRGRRNRRLPGQGIQEVEPFRIGLTCGAMEDLQYTLNLPFGN